MVRFPGQGAVFCHSSQVNGAMPTHFRGTDSTSVLNSYSHPVSILSKRLCQLVFLFHVFTVLRNQMISQSCRNNYFNFFLATLSLFFPLLNLSLLDYFNFLVKLQNITCPLNNKVTNGIFLIFQQEHYYILCSNKSAFHLL